jgi:5-methylcytosine-specific restriction endonuclease McrBC regulatory subunit McrC
VAATDSSYCLQNRAKVIHNNLRPVNHPYYSGYKYLQQLCLLILRHQSMQYSQSNSPVYGILFDGAWLWEEYLATILCNPKLAEKQFLHPSNKTGEGGIKLFDNSQNDDDEIAFSKCYRHIYPDFYRKNQIILDAKYKHLENGFVRDDLYQIISYMHTMQIAAGGFIYPKKVDDGFCESWKKEVWKTFKLANDTGTVCTIAFPVPQNSENYKEFSELMNLQEKALIQDLTKSF